jgi:uncharacterized damage-inducible protein DinB
MSLQHLMRNYAEYDLWANRTIVGHLQGWSVQLLEAAVPSSFPSIIRTVAHIRNTERFWLAFLLGGPAIFTEVSDGPHDALMSDLITRSEELVAYVHGLSADDLLQVCELQQPWMQGRLPRYEFIQHCINHTSYHRGQVITMGHALGLTTPPITDYNYYNMVVRPRL